jgi:hypothetical protein
VDKGGVAYVSIGGFEVLDAPRAERQALGDLVDAEESIARASDIVSPVELFLTGQGHVISCTPITGGMKFTLKFKVNFSKTLVKPR